MAVLAISDALYQRHYPCLHDWCGIARLGDAFALGALYAISSGVSHSAQRAFAEMLRAASDGELDFVEEASEYARRAQICKKIFLDNGFHIVYSMDGEEQVSDGFFFTAGYKEMTGGELVGELIRYGISTISLSTTGSHQQGVRVCVSQLNRPEEFEMLKERLQLFSANH